MTHNTSHVYYEDDVLIYHIDIEYLKSFPIKVAMRSLDMIKKSFQGGFFKFSDSTQQFIQEHKQEYKHLLKEEKSHFSELSQIYFDEMIGPLYTHIENTLSYVERIYQLEVYFNNGDVEEISNLPQIIWKTQSTADGKKELLIKNADELINLYGKALVLHMSILFKDHLNYEYNLQHNTNTSRYVVQSMLPLFYNEQTQSHEVLESFHGSDYFLTQKFDMAMRKESSPENILTLLFTLENLKGVMLFDDSLSQKSSLKPKK